jgi:hypothetical protein
VELAVVSVAVGVTSSAAMVVVVGSGGDYESALVTTDCTTVGQKYITEEHRGFCLKWQW